MFHAAIYRRFFQMLLIVVAATVLSGCGYNEIQRHDENVKAKWSEVLNQYKRRSDLIGNLVNTVKGYASHEERVLTEVTNARSKVGSIQLTPEMINDPKAMAQFQQAQGELSGALSRLMVVSENYPQLKADTLFLSLKDELAGTENRVAVARNRYVQAVQDYNVLIRSFPENLTAKMFGYQVKANFSVDDEKAISDAPKVDFSQPAPASPAKSQ